VHAQPRGSPPPPRPGAILHPSPAGWSFVQNLCTPSSGRGPGLRIVPVSEPAAKCRPTPHGPRSVHGDPGDAATVGHLVEASPMRRVSSLGLTLLGTQWLKSQRCQIAITPGLFCESWPT
jgi:hypothetical protein